MYKYFKRNRFSTKSSDIKGNLDKHIGTIQKKYSNVFQRIISFFTMGFKFNQFTIYDNQQHLIAHVKVKTKMTQKHFEVTYYSSIGESQILFDKQSNGREETYGIMKYNGVIYNIHSDENRYTVIKDTKRENEIASWKQIGDYAHVEGNHEVFNENQLLFILILHSFANVHVTRSVWNPFSPDTTGPPII